MTIREVIKEAINNGTNDATDFRIMYNITDMLSGFAMGICTSKLAKWREKAGTADEMVMHINMGILVNQLLDADESLLGKEDKEDASIIYVGNFLGKLAALNLNNMLEDMPHAVIEDECRCEDKEKYGCEATFCEDIKLCPKSPYYNPDIDNKGE